jgi:multiple sugar transport system permease protein
MGRTRLTDPAPPATGGPQPPRRFWLKRSAGYLMLLIAMIAFLYPLWWVVSSSFKPGASILNDPLSFNPLHATLDNFRAVFHNIPITQAFLSTTIVVTAKSAITMVFCPLTGYGFAKFNFPFKEQLFAFVLLTLMLPVLVLIIPLLLQMSQLGWINTYQSVILPGSVDAFSVFWMRQVISQVPDELLDAARIDGARTLRTFWSVVVPVIRPGLAALGVLTFFNVYNDLVWPVVALNTENRQTVSVLLAHLATGITGPNGSSTSSSPWGMLLAACTLAAIPTTLVFVALQRQFIRGLLAGSNR